MEKLGAKCRLQTGYKMQTTCRYKMEKLGAKCRLQTGYKMQTTCRYKMEKLGAKCRLQSRFRMQTYILKLPLLSEKNLYNNLGEFLPKICSQQSSYYTDLMGFKWFCA